jgi:hypothetical protein
MIIDELKHEIYMAPGPNFYYGDLNRFGLRYPKELHFLSANNVMHASNPCAGENAIKLPWAVLDALWSHGRDQKELTRAIGWCEKCCVFELAKAKKVAA